MTRQEMIDDLRACADEGVLADWWETMPTEEITELYNSVFGTEFDE